MRLTLRTLLAYLDDTLEAGEIKQIGQKVAESDTAQELIARIKQVTRRRRLTTPPDGGPGERFDANLVAEYLDNELSSEQVAELEKVCLESDVHLSEIAACHQILTLVLGEPALVPPTAKRRMYALVHGRKPKPAAKPAAAVANGQPAHDADGDETLLAPTLFRRAPWLRWAVPLAAVLLLAVLAGVLVKTLSGGDTSTASNKDKQQQDKDPSKKPDDKSKPGDGPPKDKKPGDKDKPGSDKDNKPPKDKKPGDSPPKDKKPGDKGGTTRPEGDTVAFPPAEDKPSAERREAGRLDSEAKDVVLVHKVKDEKEGERWERVRVGGTVWTGEPLVSLPGYKSDLRLDKGVGLLLWGNLPEFVQLPLLESAVTLHHNPALDAELTLHRGRVYLTNRKDKGPARVRLRFQPRSAGDEVWDLTLEEPDTVVGVELWSVYPQGPRPQDGEEPIVSVVAYVARGRASLKAGYFTFGELRAPPGRAMCYFNNKLPAERGQRQAKVQVSYLKAKLEPFDPAPQVPMQARPLRVALGELAQQLTNPGKKVEDALLEFVEDALPDRRVLGVRALGAVDAVEALIDEMGDAMRPDVRGEAIFTLRNWLARGAEQAPKLYDRRKDGAGLLKDKRFRPEDAEIVLDLLAGISPEGWHKPETYEVLIGYLKHSRLEVRELAIRLLLYRVPEGKKIPYDPAGGVEQRNEGYTEWKKLIKPGTVPPEPKAQP